MSGTYRLDDLRIDTRRRSVHRGDAPVDVGGLSFDLLAYLLSQGDRVVSFDELIAAVWTPAIVGEETVTQRVKLLRQALDDDGRNPRYLRSVRGKGYQLCSTPLVLPDIGAAAVPGTTTTGSRRVLLLLVLPLLALAVLLLLRRIDQKDDLAVSLGLRRPDTAAPLRSEREEMLQRARYYAGIGQKDDIEHAVVLYETLLQRDAADRAAQVGLSFAYSTRVCLYNQAPEWAGRAQALAESALTAEPDNSLAEAALAYSHDCRGHMAAAIAHYERAVALDPAARIDSAASLAYLYMVKGRLADALARNLEVQRSGSSPRYLHIQIARNLELLGETHSAGQRYARSFQLYPDNVFSNSAWPRHLLLQARLGEAQAALDEAQRRSEHPELYLLQAELALLRGERTSAATAFAAAARLRPHAQLAQTLARLYASPGTDDAWIAQRIVAIDPGPQRGKDEWPEDQLELALLQLARGDKAAALASLHDAVEAGFRDRSYLQVSALYKPLGAEPGFAALLDDIAGRVSRERERAAGTIATLEADDSRP